MAIREGDAKPAVIILGGNLKNVYMSNNKFDIVYNN